MEIININDLELICETDKNIKKHQYVLYDYTKYFVVKVKDNKAYVDEVCDYDDETYEQDDAVCPICGHKIQDSFEFRDNEEDYECPECGALLNIYRDVVCYYTTTISENNDDKYVVVEV